MTQQCRYRGEEKFRYNETYLVDDIVTAYARHVDVHLKGFETDMFMLGNSLAKISTVRKTQCSILEKVDEKEEE